MQCGGSEAECTVEFRVFNDPGNYKHYEVGHTDGSKQSASVKMSGGVVSVQKGEAITAAEAAELFDLFVAGQIFPKKYALRETDV